MYKIRNIINKEIIIHAGAPKAASTYLQKAIFPNLKDVYFFFPLIRKYRDDREKEVLSPLDEILIKFSMFDKELNELNDINEIKQQVYDYFNSIEASRIILSNELFFQKPNLTKLFKELFPQAKILIVIREQADWLESRFNQTAKTQGYSEIENLLRTWAYDLNWLEVYQDYANNFGKNNVLVLPFEQLKQNKKEFLDNLYGFIGAEPFYPEDKAVYNQSYSVVSHFISRILNKFLPPKGKKFLRSFIEKHLDKYFRFFNKDVIKKDIKHLIKIYYEKSNTELSEITGLNLEKYGYPVIGGNAFKKLQRIDFQKHIDKIAKRHENKRIVVYGAGSFFEYVAKNYDLNGLNIIAVTDKKFQGSESATYMGYKTITPYQIAEYKPDVILSGLYEPRVTNLVKFFIFRIYSEKFVWDEMSKFSLINNLRLL